MKIVRSSKSSGCLGSFITTRGEEDGVWGGAGGAAPLRHFPARLIRWIPSSPTVLYEIRQLTKTSQWFRRQFFAAIKPLVSMLCSPSLEANEAALVALLNLAFYGRSIFLSCRNRNKTWRNLWFSMIKAVEKLDGRVVDGREMMVQFAKYGPNTEKIHKGRILEPVEKLKGGSRSRTPRPSSRYRDEYVGYRRRSRSRSGDKYYGRERDHYRSRTRSRSRSPDYHRRHRRGKYDDDYDDERSPMSPPRRSRSPSRSRSPKGGGNVKASASPPHSHGRADSRSPLQRSDSDEYSSTTYQIVKCIKNFVHQMEAIVLMALLQPPPETFDLFDDLVVLSEGHVVYEGPREQVLELFESLGFQKPLRKGTANFLVTSKKDLAQYWADSSNPYEYILVSNISEAYKKSIYGRSLESSHSVRFNKSKGHVSALRKKEYGVSKWRLFQACFSREFLLIKRHSFLYIFKTIQVAFVGFITCTLFIRTRLHHTYVIDGSLYLRCLFFAFVHMMFNGFSELPVMIFRLSVFYKQRDNNFYHAWAWSVSSWILLVPYSVVEAIVWSIIVYYSVRFSPGVGRFFRYVFVLFSMHQMPILSVQLPCLLYSFFGDLFALFSSLDLYDTNATSALIEELKRLIEPTEDRKDYKHKTSKEEAHEVQLNEVQLNAEDNQQESNTAGRRPWILAFGLAYTNRLYS
ncbi:hypothetical protein Lser_V15G19745 [Lactuca serriola]